MPYDPQGMFSLQEIPLLHVSPPGRKANRTDEIKSWIEAEITSGRLPPGARVDEQALAERFEVSRTPVREALIQLSSMGLIDMRQRRGAIVTQMSVKQVISMLEVMAELEGLAAKLAARRMLPSERTLLERVHQDSRPAVDAEAMDAYDAVNKRLHELIYDCSRNEYLAAHIRDVRQRLRLYRRYPFQRTGRMEQSFQEHASIVAAILGGDGEKADRLMQDHITVGGHIFADLVAELSHESPDTTLLE